MSYLIVFFSELDYFVPPIRSLETLHNQFSFQTFLDFTDRNSNPDSYNQNSGIISATLYFIMYIYSILSLFFSFSSQLSITKSEALILYTCFFSLFPVLTCLVFGFIKILTKNLYILHSSKNVVCKFHII